MIEMFNRLTMGRAVIVGFLLSAIYYFVMFDSGELIRSQIVNSQSEISRIQGEVQKAEESLQRARDFQEASQSLGHSIEKLLSFIPANFRIGQLMQTVSQEARLSGLDISRLSPKTISEPNRVEDFLELGITLELTGQYDQVLRFMSSLTRKRQIFVFDKLDMIEMSADGDGLIRVTADIHAFSYQGKSQL